MIEVTDHPDDGINSMVRFSSKKLWSQVGDDQTDLTTAPEHYGILEGGALY